MFASLKVSVVVIAAVSGLVAFTAVSCGGSEAGSETKTAEVDSQHLTSSETATMQAAAGTLADGLGKYGEASGQCAARLRREGAAAISCGADMAANLKAAVEPMTNFLDDLQARLGSGECQTMTARYRTSLSQLESALTSVTDSIDQEDITAANRAIGRVTDSFDGVSSDLAPFLSACIV